MAWAPNYVTNAELAAYVRIDDSEDDAQISLAIAAASRAIDRACKRQFGKVETAVARYYTACLDPVADRMAVRIDDLMTITDLVVEVDTNGDETYPDEVTSFTRYPRNAEADGKPWTKLIVGPNSEVGFPSAESAIRVTGLFGWTEVPDPVKQACLLQASRFLSRRDAPFGIAGSPDSGSEMRLLAKVDPDVEVSLSYYKRYERGFA